MGNLPLNIRNTICFISKKWRFFKLSEMEVLLHWKRQSMAWNQFGLKRHTIEVGERSMFYYRRLDFENCSYRYVPLSCDTVVKIDVKHSCEPHMGFIPPIPLMNSLFLVTNRRLQRVYFRVCPRLLTLETTVQGCEQESDDGIFEIDVLPNNCGAVISLLTRVWADYFSRNLWKITKI